MFETISIIKGVHPGIILEQELKRRKIGKSQFALSVNEYPQILGDITKAKRKMNPALSLKIEAALGMEEGYFMILQTFYDIEQEKKKQHQAQPNLKKLRPVLFWDTTIEKIDWEKQKISIIKRVLERGNAKEKEEIIRFYGKDVVNATLKVKK
jgi:plasmid maintenance system antidote protein VapI